MNHKLLLIGTIAGDIIGAPYEFIKGAKPVNFELFDKETSFTDDTVMTIATAKKLIAKSDYVTQPFARRNDKSVE